MSHIPIHPTVLNDLKAHLHGELIGPNDEGYESARKVWNGLVDKHPALIVRCQDVSDVISAVQFARDQDLPIAVRAGGHDVSGHSVCDNGLMIDLSQMKRIEVDHNSALHALSQVSPVGNSCVQQSSLAWRSQRGSSPTSVSAASRSAVESAGFRANTA